MTDLINSPSLRAQLDLYRNQAELWGRDHPRAMARFDLEADLSLGLAVFDLLKKLLTVYNEIRQQRRVGFEPQQAERIRKLFAEWYALHADMLEAIGSFKREGYPVEGADEFMDACMEARILTEDFDRIVHAMEQFSRGGGRPRGDVMDELRRQAVR